MVQYNVTAINDVISFTVCCRALKTELLTLYACTQPVVIDYHSPLIRTRSVL